MAKLIYERDDGTQIIVREGSFTQHSILFADDYFAKKLWSELDIREYLRQEGYVGSPEQVAAMINTGVFKSLNECTDQDWEYFSQALRICKARGEIS